MFNKRGVTVEVLEVGGHESEHDMEVQTLVHKGGGTKESF